MYKDKLLRYAIPAQKKFAKMYNNYEDGLVAITDRYVQITEEKFADIFKQFNGELNYTIRKMSGDSYEAAMIIDKVPFITVGTKKELKKAGLFV